MLRLSCVLCAVVLFLCAGVTIAGPYTVQLVSGMDHLSDVNDHGLVAGFARVDSKPQAAVWNPIEGRTFLPTPDGILDSSAFAINNHGVAVGHITVANYVREAIMWTPGPDGYTYTLLGNFGQESSIGRDINDNGVIVGYAYTSMGRVAWYRRANGGQVILPSVPGLNRTLAEELNSNNTVGGSSSHSSGGTYVAWRWEDAGSLEPVSDLDVLYSSSNYCQVRGISETGNPIGSLNGPDLPGQMAIFTGSGPVNLGDIVPGQVKYAGAWAVNESGMLVGEGVDASNQYHAVMWEPTSPNATTGTMYKLTDLLDSSGSNWELTGARGVNSHGQIVGAGHIDGTSEYLSCFLTPAGSVFLGESVGITGGGTGVIGGVAAGFENVTIAGTLTCSSQVLTAAQLVATYNALPHSPPADANFLVLDIGFDGVFSGSAEISVRFDENLLDPSQSLVACHWTGSDWEILPCIVDLENYTATFTTTSFSPFALMAVPEPATLTLLAIGSLAILRKRRK
jgi:uncharacterized membrane protein